MAYHNNGFCWHGIASDGGTAFYAEVLGWGAREVPMGDAKVPTFFVNEVPRAHLTAPEGEPRWNHYLRVDDVDARTEAARANGGAVVVPPTDMVPGRYSVVTTPSGAPLYLFHEADETVEPAPDGVGSVIWVELWSRDLNTDLAWLRSTFGFEVREMQMGNGPYHILTDGGDDRAGAMVAADEVPAHWLAWVEVADVDATVARALSNGGSQLAEPFDVPDLGRLAILADSAGARFGILTPTA